MHAEMPSVLLAVNGELRLLDDCAAHDLTPEAVAVIGVKRHWSAMQSERSATHGYYDVEFELRGACLVRNHWHRLFWAPGDRLVLRATARGVEAVVVGATEPVQGPAVVVGTPLVGPRLDTARRSNVATLGSRGVLRVLLDLRVV